MNGFKTLEERREATRRLIEEVLYELKVLGYTITMSYNGPDLQVEYEVHPSTLFIKALEIAF